MATPQSRLRSTAHKPTKHARKSEPAARVRRKVSDLNHDFHSLGDVAAHAAAEKIDELSDQAAEYYAMGRDKAAEYLAQRREQWEGLQDSIVEYVREKPVKSVCIAAVTGAILGRIMIRF